MTTKSKPPEIALLDSNVLIYAEQRKSTHHQAAKHIRDQALRGEIAACISPQVLAEFFAIITNPRRVETTLTPEKAADQVRKYYESKHLVVIFPGKQIIKRMLALLEAHPVSGQDIHDLHLVATMLENGAIKVYTFNASDFAPFSEIEVLTPVAEPADETDESDKSTTYDW